MMRRLFLLPLVLSVLLLDLPVRGQLRVAPIEGQEGHVGLGLALRRLNVAGTFMMTTAHPDDENNALLAMLSHGEGFRTVLVTATRGEGGQNEIGPELFDALAVLRSEELLAAHRFDGTEQYYTRAIDFGYSFSIDETFEKWGREEILGDFVRLIRTIRPDVITGFIFEGAGGGQHHQASARLTLEAFHAAADAARFSEQLVEGLRPWQAAKYYSTEWFFGRQQPPAGVRLLQVDAAVFDPLLGRTYQEIGSAARSMHKCQGMSQLLALPGPAPRPYRLRARGIPGRIDRDEAGKFDGVDTSLEGLARYAGPGPPQGLTTGLAAIAGHAAAATRAFESGGAAGTLVPLSAGLDAVRDLRGRLGGLELDATAIHEIDFRLEQKERQFQEALILAHGVRLEALADDGLVVPGQDVDVSIVLANRGAHDVVIRTLAFEGFDGQPSGCEPGTASRAGVFSCTAAARVPDGAAVTDIPFRRRTDAARYDLRAEVPFGVPFAPTPFRVRLELSVAGSDVAVESSVEYRSGDDIVAGEKRMELKVVPPLSVRLAPEVAVVPLPAKVTTLAASGGGSGRPRREMRVTVTHHGKGATGAQVALDLPAGWAATPAVAPVRFSREDEAITVRFEIAPPPGVRTGDAIVRAIVRRDGESFDRGYQAVEYPHIQRRHLFQPAAATVKVLDVRVPSVTVGYIMGVGDQVPPAIEQLGLRVESIDADQLAWGDLDRYDVIVTGVRAYERRADLRAQNQGLLDYVERGGTVIVQYNKFEFNDAQYGPYPALVGRDRITDEEAPVRVLVPQHPVFTHPNRIAPDDWAGWVQERGLYFLGERDPRYVDLLEMEDPFEYNSGVKRGALVEAQAGKGRWLYVGLGLWRQLPAGTDGAYRLMANLLALGEGRRAQRKSP
jgi:LmbE family N-acetylglucosaminyl deacetylase